MTYTIGDRKISIDEDHLSESDKQLILSHLKLFKYCLNQISFKFLINLKNIIHLYSDIITIYASLLRKIPNYDDITLMTNRTKLNLLKLEEDFDKLFGSNTISNNDYIYYHQNSNSNRNLNLNSQSQINLNENEILKKLNWQEKNYEFEVKKLSILFLQCCNETFELIIKNLNCIEIFFNNFNNLKKLLIPFLLNQTQSIQKSLIKSLYLFKLTTITDDLISIKSLNPTILKQLKKIEKITSGIEKESIILKTAFMTFDPSLQQYTSILLGKAILKREINDSDCQIIKRRNICFQATEHVVSIPLTEDQNSNSMKQFTDYITYAIVVLVIILLFVFMRLSEILFK